MFGYKLLAALALSAAPLHSYAAPTALQSAWELIQRALDIPNTKDIKSTYMVNNGVRTDSKPCVFYNVRGGQATRARIQQLAQQVGGLSLYDLYFPDSHDPTPFNPDTQPTTGFAANDQLRDWFQVTSRAFAQVCSGKAYLIWDGTAPFVNADEWWQAIWSTDEFDAVMTGQTGITEVYTINPGSGAVSSDPVWRAGQAAPPGWWFPGQGVDPPAKRWLDNLTTIIEDDWKKIFSDMWGPDYKWPCDDDLKQSRVDMISTFMSTCGNSTLPAYKFTNSTQSLGRREPYTDGIVKHPLSKRAPSTNGIEQNPDGSVFSPGGNEPWVPGIPALVLQQTLIPRQSPVTVQPGEQFNMSVVMWDNEQTNVVVAVGPESHTGTEQWDVDSRLRYVLEVTPGVTLDDPVGLKYGPWSWSTNQTDASPDNLAACVLFSKSSDGNTNTYICAFFADQFQ